MTSNLETRSIIHGNNKDVLPFLLSEYREKVQCIYIDPPYNNGESYNHYHDDFEHEVWLKFMEETLTNLKPFLKETGSIWISIDDSEVHYLKVLADKVFGRKNFITTIIWQQRTTRENRKVFSNNHEYVLVYAINPKKFSLYRNPLPAGELQKSRYKNPDNDPRGPWQSVSLNVQDGHASANQYYTILSPSGKKHMPPPGRCWAYNEERMLHEITLGNVWFGRTGTGVPRKKKFLNESDLRLTPETLWFAEDVSTNKSAKKHINKLFVGKPVFDTPKPEELIRRILEISTNEGDLILDAFLGSGTTTAVAHKMSRNYIGVEQGGHIVDYVAARMEQVIDGESGGITDEVNWKGGGNFDLLDFTGQSLEPHHAMAS